MEAPLHSAGQMNSTGRGAPSAFLLPIAHCLLPKCSACVLRTNAVQIDSSMDMRWGRFRRDWTRLKRGWSNGEPEAC